MKISPRYGSIPIVQLDGAPDTVGAPFLRQRRRLAGMLTELTHEQWESPSRCEGWRVQDVVAHLAGVDQFWSISLTSGLAGAPTRFLADFDPKATPASMVDAARAEAPSETLARFQANSERFCATVEALDDAGWRAIAESPPGHVTVTALAHHALWDAWIHERDILQPLGISQIEEADEVVASLRYAAALGPTLAIQSTAGRRGSLTIDATNPDSRFVVTVADEVTVGDGDPPEGALHVDRQRGRVARGTEHFAAPLGQSIPDDKAWLIAGLAEVFESGAR